MDIKNMKFTDGFLPMTQAEEELMTKITNEMSAKLDWEVLSMCLVQSGWTRVMVPINHGRLEMTQWAGRYCTGGFKQWAYEFIFRDEKDALLFSLRWV